MFKKKFNFTNFLFSVKNAFDELRTHYKVCKFFEVENCENFKNFKNELGMKKLSTNKIIMFRRKERQ